MASDLEVDKHTAAKKLCSTSQSSLADAECCTKACQSESLFDQR